jgi:hypothetical protein
MTAVTSAVKGLGGIVNWRPVEADSTNQGKFDEHAHSPIDKVTTTTADSAINRIPDDEGWQR